MELAMSFKCGFVNNIAGGRIFRELVGMCILSTKMASLPLHAFYQGSKTVCSLQKHRFDGDYPWRCLCFGFFEHTTYTLPFRFTMLHPSHMTFTDDLTFIPRAVDGISAVVPSDEIAGVELCMWGIVGTRKRASSGLLEASKALNMM